jgi:hypothetical protein
MSRRGTPEADLQRAVVQALRLALPRTAIIHHSANEVTESGPRGAKRQAILAGMGVHPGFADLVVMCDGRVLFLELKAPKGRLRSEQETFRDAILAQGHGWALVRSVDDALGALVAAGLPTRIAAGPAVRARRTETSGGSSSAAARGAAP